MSSSMKAAVLYRPEDLRIEARPVPDPEPGCVVVAVEAAGICGTDVAVYRGVHPATLPIIPGHEFAGRILALGEGVDGVRVGERVLAEGGWACGRCENCQAGRPRACGARVLLGRTVDGCFAGAVAVRASSVYPLMDGISALEAQSVVTLATALHAADRAGDLSGRRVAIIGPGHAGLLLLQVCQIRGVGDTVVFGTRPHRLDLAQRLGAGAAVNVGLPEFDRWRTLPAAEGFDVSFEASGTAEGLARAFRTTRRGGIVVAYGIIHTALEGVPGFELYARELTVIASQGAGTSYQEAIGLLADRKIRVGPLITHRLSLDEADRGFSLMIDRLEDVVRVVLTPD
ncbi:MAG TPA: alcohol dehydrogenase catalytic domain-containing protein [bacterium]|nr:alcohol dehydrogenase catalytic domain-containing protein [bacterium]